MPNTYATEAALYLNNTPVKLAFAGNHNADLRRFRATITLAAQASGDTITLAQIPAGSTFAFGVLTSTVSLSTSTIAIGKAGTPAKYKAAAVFTAVETPTLFGLTTAMDDEPLTSAETVILTIAALALPGSGTLIVDLYFSAT
jgi:hypothetical protein